MLFNSYSFFLAFLPVFLVSFYIARKISYGNTRMRSVCKWLIIAGSLIFYAPFGAYNLLVLFGSILVNAALGLAGTGKRDESGRCTLLGAGIALNAAVLLFFKFSGLVLARKIFFPVAISFYTFNQISFLADICKGDIREFDPADYLSYILFFPKLIQGPLMGYGEFSKNLNRCIEGPAKSEAAGTGAGTEGAGGAVHSGIDWEMLLRGLYLFSMGLFKKVIMADTIGKAVDFGYADVAGLGSLEAVLVMVFYSFQLYFDFSGYCDMAGGICMMIGFELPVNFNSPYRAVNIVDFWKRWHITLTGFFTRYVYIPLGGNRRGAARMYLNFMIVFLLSGLWHGNGITFIVWGAMHGVLFVITRASGRREGHDRIKTEKTSYVGREGLAARMINALKVLATFLYVSIAWVFFRAETVSDALTLLGRIFTGGIRPLANKLSASFQLDEIWYVLKVTPLMKLNFAWDLCLWMFLAVSVFMIFFCRNAIGIARDCRIGIRTTLITAFLLVWCTVSFSGVSTFLYMNF